MLTAARSCLPGELAHEGQVTLLRDGGEYKLGDYILILADCRGRTELEFFLGTARTRRQRPGKTGSAP